MKVGYARYISTNQAKEMENANVDKMVFGVSSQSFDQKHFKDFIHTLNNQDTLVIESIDALGDDILEIVENLILLKDQDINLQILRIQVEDIDNLYRSDTQEILKEYLIHCLQQIDLKLKDNIRRRQSDGALTIKELNAKRKSKGRPKKYSEDAEDPYDREMYFKIVEMLKENVTISDIASEMDMSRTTIYRIKEDLDSKT